MKILNCNKFYYEMGGTERYVFQLEQILRGYGHEVIPFAMRDPRNKPSSFERYFVETVSYDSLLRSRRPLAVLAAALRTIYSEEAKTKMQRLVAETRPTIAHLHNIYHQISPSILPVLRQNGIPAVLTLHDVKLLCPGHTFYSRGMICERCLSGGYYNAARHRCLKNSFPASVLATLEAYIHAIWRTYERNISVFVTPSRFLQTKLLQSKFGAANVEYVPHPIDLETFIPNFSAGDYFVFFGRLSGEKGVGTLLRAMSRLSSRRLLIVGDGPAREDLALQARQLELRNVQFVGFRQGAELRSIVGGSLAVVVPSEWYENAPFSIYEAFALGKAVVASRIGGIPELVDHGENGLLFPSGQDHALADQLSLISEHPSLAVEMGRAGRQKAETLWTFEQHYQRLRQVYEMALNRQEVPTYASAN